MFKRREQFLRTEMGGSDVGRLLAGTLLMKTEKHSPGPGKWNKE